MLDPDASVLRDLRLIDRLAAHDAGARRDENVVVIVVGALLHQHWHTTRQLNHQV